MSKSVFANLHNRIDAEFAAMCLGGLAAGTAKHQFIEAKMKRVGILKIN